MKARNLLVGAAVAALVAGSSGTASAIPIDLGGYNGKIQIIFQNFENFTGNGALQVSNSNYGILQVTSILDASSKILYQAPLVPSAANPLIVGVFSGIHVGSVTATSAEADKAGAFSFYDVTNPANDFGTIANQGTAGYTAAGCAVNQQCYHNITDQGYDNILNMSLVPGASSADPTSFLHSTVTSFSPIVGDASGYADITGGSDASQFKLGTQTTAAGTQADLFLKDSFCQNTDPNCTTVNPSWSLGSHDPVVTSVQAPEPASLALFASQLLGLGMFARWRQKRRGG